MSKRIEKLTAAQEAILSEVRGEWLSHGLSTEPADRITAEQGVRVAYQAAGLEPPPLVIWLGSPMGGAIGQAVLRSMELPPVGAQVGAQVGDQVGAQVGAQVGDQVGAQVGAQVWAQVGAQVGDQVGDQVWAQVGDQVGAQVGAQVWAQVGDQVGDQVRAQVRAQVGDQVWAQVRAQVGDQVRAQVRAQVRDQVRAQVGDQVGAQVGAQVWAQVGDQVGDQVRAQVRAQVGDQVRAQVRAQVGDQVGAQVGAQVWAQVGDQVGDQVRAQVRAQVGDQVRAQVRAQVGDQVRDQVRAQVRAQVRDQVRDYYSGLIYGQHWADYCGWIDAAARISVHHLEPFAGHLMIGRSAGWWWAFKGAAILTERPQLLKRDPQGRLHSGTGMAVKYPDGWGFHAWHGTRMPAELYAGDVTLEQILKQPNSEVRRCAIELTGWDKLEHQLGAPVATAADPGNPGRELALYDVPRSLYDTPVRLVLMTNGSPDRDGAERRYGETVPADMSDPVSAAAWQYGVSRETYAQLQRRT